MPSTLHVPSSYRKILLVVSVVLPVFVNQIRIDKYNLYLSYF